MDQLPAWLQLAVPLVSLIALIAIMWQTVQALKGEISRLGGSVDRLNDSVHSVVTGDAVSNAVAAHTKQRLDEQQAELNRHRRYIHDIRNLTIYLVAKSARGSDPEVQSMLEKMSRDE